MHATSGQIKETHMAKIEKQSVYGAQKASTMWLPPVGQRAEGDVLVSKRIVAQMGGAKMRVRPRPAHPQSALTWVLPPWENSVITGSQTFTQNPFLHL